MKKARRKVIHKRRPVHRRQIQRKAPTAAIMRIPAPPMQPWKLNDEEVQLVKTHIAPGSTDTELAFCLATARRFKLDPFRRQIWFVPRTSNEGETRVKKFVPMVGIDGLLHIAARDHKDFGTIGEPEYGPPMVVKFQVNGKGQERNLTVPSWARVKIWKKGIAEPTVARVKWSEIYRSIDYSPMVRQMPEHMLGKCATAHAVRKAYPATDGLYVAEEMPPDGPPDFTPSGRRILHPDKDDGRTLDIPPVQEDPKVQDYLARLTPEERAAEEAAMKRAQVPKVQSGSSAVPRVNAGPAVSTSPSVEAGNGGTTREGVSPARPVVRYRYFYDTHTARIIRPAPGILTQDLKVMLRKYQRGDHVQLNDEELEAMKREFQIRGMDLKPEPREPGE